MLYELYSLNPRHRSCGALFLQQGEDLFEFTIEPMAKRFIAIRRDAFEVIWEL